MYKNISGQKVAIFAWDAANGQPKTGDAANITAQISKDGGASTGLTDTNPTELDATNHKGVYIFDFTQAESSADLIVLTPASSTSNVVIRPLIITPTLLTSIKAGYLNASIADVEADTQDIQSQIGTDGAGLTDLGGMSTAMKAEVNAEADQALADYDPPTRAEATADKNEIISEVDANETLLNAIGTLVTSINSKTTNLPADPADQSQVEASISNVITAIGNLNNISVSDILAGVIEGSVSMKNVLQLVLAFMGGKGSYTDNSDDTYTIKYRSQADDKDRVAITADQYGQRSTIILDFS